MKPKRRPPQQLPKLELEEVVGLTTKNASGLASDPSTGVCAYVAGCVAVVFAVDSGARSYLMVSSRPPKPLSCVALSRGGGGGYVAAGESGQQPVILIWDRLTHTLLSTLKGHNYGVSCIDFSPDGKHLVSVGHHKDGFLCIWEWRCARLITKLKVNIPGSRASSVSFLAYGNFFVTAGLKHLKLWTIGSSTKSRSQFLVVDGKPANLGCLKSSSFVSFVATASVYLTANSHHIFALTDAGTLCLLHINFSVRKSVDLKVEKGFALSVSDKLIACACSKGIVRLFLTENLNYAGSLEHSEGNEKHQETYLTHDVGSAERKTRTLPDAIACQFSSPMRLVVIYGDHSLCVWDVRDVSKATRCFVVVPHGKCIWDVKNMPCKNLHSPALACVARGCQCGVSFTTCSADGTIRLWELASQSDSSTSNAKQEPAVTQQFFIPNTEHKGATCLKSCWVLEQDNGVEVDCLGFRSMAVDSDGRLLAAGDSHGNLHVLNLYTSGYTHIQKAHEAEILSLSFSSPGPKPDTEGPQPDSHHLLASGGRDQIIHVYDVERNFDLIESFNEHSSSVTSVKFTHAGHKLVSSSADRSLVVRDLDIVDAGCRILHRHQHIASLGTVYDMDIDPSMEFAVTIGQDKRISMYSLASGKLVRTLKPDGDRGETIKVSVDPSGSYLACTYSDKSLNIYDFTSGELVTRATGHAEVITGVIFLPDCRHVVSVGGDSCIFIWKLPVLSSTNMLKKIMEHYGSLTPVSSTQSACPTEGILDEGALQLANDKSISCLDLSNHGGETTCIKEEISEKNSIFKFSVSRLPKWAQTELMKSKQNVSGEGELILTQIKEPDTGDTRSTLKAPTTEHLTPYQSKLGGNQVCTSVSPFSSSAGKSSPLPQGITSFALDNRWNTIHTVCLDPNDFPATQDLEESCKPISSTEGFLYMEGQHGLKAVDITKIIQTPNNEVEIDGKESRFDEQCRPGDILKAETSIPTKLSHEMVQLETVINTVLGKRSYSEAMETPMRKDREVDICDEHSQGDDIFSQHFSTLSKPFKGEKSRYSERRCSAQYIMKSEITGCKKLFKLTSEGCVNSLGSSWTDQDKDISRVSTSNPAHIAVDPIDISTIEHPFTENEINGNQSHDVPPNHGIPEKSAEYREALHNLESAAETVLRLYKDLGVDEDGKVVSGAHTQELFQLATQIIPSVEEKVRSLATLVHSSKSNSSSDIAVEAHLEPLIERYSERLTHQVLELVKKNL